MRVLQTLALLVLAAAVIAGGAFAPSASASFTCANARRSPTCSVTLTATARDDSRSGSSNVTFSAGGGLVLVTCNDSTISSDVAGADIPSTGSSNITFTGRNVDFRTSCRVSSDGACTVSVAVTPNDSRWTVTLSEPSGTSPHRVALSIGEVRITFSTCFMADNNGVATLPAQSLGTTCTNYTVSTGILTITCAATYSCTCRSLGRGVISFRASYHVLVDGGITSLTVS